MYGYISILITLLNFIESKSDSRSVASADDYLPAFIYIVLKANPTMLYSNMNFISRYAYEKRVLQGEHAYHFCSLNAIINHIENLNAQHLNMTQDKFEDYCNGLIDMNSSSNVLKLIQSNLKILSELKDKQKLLRQETKKLQIEITHEKLIRLRNYKCTCHNMPILGSVKIDCLYRTACADVLTFLVPTRW